MLKNLTEASNRMAKGIINRLNESDLRKIGNNKDDLESKVAIIIQNSSDFAGAYRDSLEWRMMDSSEKPELIYVPSRYAAGMREFVKFSIILTYAAHLNNSFKKKSPLQESSDFLSDRTYDATYSDVRYIKSSLEAFKTESTFVRTFNSGRVMVGTKFTFDPSVGKIVEGESRLLPDTIDIHDKFIEEVDDRHWFVKLLGGEKDTVVKVGTVWSRDLSNEYAKLFRNGILLTELPEGAEVTRIK